MAALLLVAGGCATGSDDPPQPMGPMLGDGTSAPGPTGTSGDAAGTSTSGVSATSVATVADSSGGGVDSTAGVASTGEPGADASSTGPPPTCPPDPMDDACTMCGKENCCPEYIACLGDMLCSCTLDCYLGGTPIADCIAMCGPSTLALDLYTCADAACGALC